MALKYALAQRNARMDALPTGIGASGLLRIYNGTQPAGPGTAIGAQVLLAQLALSATSAPAASAGVLTFNAIANDASAAASGTPTWFRITTSGGTGVIDGSAAVGSGDINFSAAIVITGVVSCTSLVFTDGTG